MTNAPAPDAPLLQVEAITKTFGGFTALDNISVDIRKGERFGLIGPNGSGKTTLINCISGALRPQAGSVVFCGENITELPPHLRARRGIARSFQIPRPFKSMTVLENLMVGLDFAAVGSSLPEEDVAMSILTRMGLASKAGAPPGNVWLLRAHRTPMTSGCRSCVPGRVAAAVHRSIWCAAAPMR